MSLKSFVEGLVAEKQFCSWHQAATAAGVRKFMPTEIPTITKAFNEAVAGSDALIVSSEGEYGCKDEIYTRHCAFLQANGFTEVPPRRQKTKKAPAVKLCSAATKVEAQSEIAALKEQVAALVALLPKK